MSVINAITVKCPSCKNMIRLQVEGCGYIVRVYKRSDIKVVSESIHKVHMCYQCNESIVFKAVKKPIIKY